MVAHRRPRRSRHRGGAGSRVRGDAGDASGSNRSRRSCRPPRRPSVGRLGQGVAGWRRETRRRLRRGRPSVGHRGVSGAPCGRCAVLLAERSRPPRAPTPQTTPRGSAGDAARGAGAGGAVCAAGDPPWATAASAAPLAGAAEPSAPARGGMAGASRARVAQQGSSRVGRLRRRPHAAAAPGTRGWGERDRRVAAYRRPHRTASRDGPPSAGSRPLRGHCTLLPACAARTARGGAARGGAARAGAARGRCTNRTRGGAARVLHRRDVGHEQSPSGGRPGHSCLGAARISLCPAGRRR